MSANQQGASLSTLGLKQLRSRLLGGEPFREMTRAFIEAAIEARPSNNPQFDDYYRAAVGAITEENALEVARLAKSPIEKTFLHSLILTFIKNDGLGLLVHRTDKDTPGEINEFRKTLSYWREFFAWFRANRPAGSVEAFLDGEVARGALDPDERQS